MNIQKQAIPTTNYEVGRRGNSIKKIVIHWMVTTLAGADAQFKKVNGGTSAHYGIENDVIYQWVEDKDTAYHAGKFSVNLESIGIEHSADPNRPATDQTYKTSGELVRIICLKYNIPIDRTHIIKHSQVVATQCPGTIDIDKIINYAKQGTMDPIIQRKASWYDRIIVAREGSQDTNIRTDAQDQAFTDRMIREKDRAVKFDQLVIKAFGSGDSNVITADEVYNKIGGDTAPLKDRLNKIKSLASL
jgi:hypothetical protein